MSELTKCNRCMYNWTANRINKDGYKAVLVSDPDEERHWPKAKALLAVEPGKPTPKKGTPAWDKAFRSWYAELPDACECD